jgi:DNA polymerase elongation subunit (family B)
MKRDDRGFINSDEVLVWECIDGKNTLKRHPGVFEFYVKKDDGEFTSVFNEKLTKYEFDTYTEFRQARKYLLTEKNLKLYESDISPDTKVLSKHYYEKPSATLNVLLYDIEVDYKTISYGDDFVAKARMVGTEKVIDTPIGEIRNLSAKQQLTIEVYDPKNKYWKLYPHSSLAYEGPVGFSSPLNPYAPINAVSIYKQWLDKSIVMAVPPPGFDLSTIDQSLHELTEIRFYKNEKELLLAYLDEIEDASLLSGWNCVSENESVFLSDRILPIKSVKAGQQTMMHGTIRAHKNTGVKKSYRLTTYTGTIVETSADHVFPVFTKNHTNYSSLGNLLKTKQDLPLHEVVDLVNDSDTDVYVMMHRHKNVNRDLTYRDLIIDHFEQLFESGVEIYIHTESLIEQILSCVPETIKTIINDENVYAKRKKLAIRLNDVYSTIPKEMVHEWLRDDIVYFKTVDSGKTTMYEMNPNEVISKDILQLLGFIYTDGFYSNYDKKYSMCNKYIEVMQHYTNVAFNENLVNKLNLDLKPSRDGCYYRGIPASNKFSFLHMMIYSNRHKRLDVTLLSRLSFTQFTAFFSGFVDGDGWITQEVGAINLCNYNNDMFTMNKLLLWNDVYVSGCGSTSLAIPNYETNKHLYDSLSLIHPKRKSHIENKIEPVSISNSSSKRLRKFVTDDYIIVKIRSIEQLEDVTMYDIMTEKDYFVCNGIETHNSNGFDDPYVARRIEMVLGADQFKRLSFEGANTPMFRELFVKGAKQLRVDYSGRVQLDYLELFKKFEGGERASFKLESVAEDHLPHLKKLTYPGSLEQLYTNDFNHFLRYNVRDTEILKGFETKLTYIQLANDMIHSSTNQFNHIFGTVRMVDNAIVNYCHYEIDRIVPDRWDTRDGKIQGAYVLFPQRGLHKWICSIDINSLYPSAIRAINISPETVIGQFENNIKDWTKIFEGIEDDITIKYDNGSYETKKTQEWVDYFAEQCWAVSGYGTVFTQKELGIIPSLLAKWYSQRKVFQAEMRKYVKEAEALKYDFSSGHAVERTDYDKDQYFEITEKSKYYNRLQYIFKIKLNSTYGCLSNYNFRFFRLELGESTTGTSRQILRHQCRQTNYIIDGEYYIDFPIYESMAIIDNINKETSKRLAEEDGEFEFTDEIEDDSSTVQPASLADLVDLDHKEYYHPGFVTHEMALDGPKFNGEFSSQVVVYGDTDSTYFTVPANNKEEAIEFADAVAEAVNQSYPAFMRKAFHCQPEYDLQVKCGREVVSDHGLFVEKKRYILHVVDNEGETVDKMKIMGLDIKKTTLPKIISAKLTDFIRRLLYGEDWSTIAIDIVNYKEGLMAFDNLVDVGLPKNVNNLEKYEMVYRVDGVKARLPGNVAAALHFNERLKEYGDNDTEIITSGMKIRVYYLKTKMLGKFTSIALPSDIEHIPDWFMENFVPQIDKTKQLSRLVDNPLQNILKAIDVSVPTAQTVHADELFNF